MDVREYQRDHILLFDGAMGTMLQQRGLEPGGLPELLNLTHPEVVTQIHREYVEAGSDVVSANTFQAHGLKLGEQASVEEVVEAGIRCAKQSEARFAALDVGPLGQLMEPMGTISFDRAYEVYARMMRAGEQAGADLIVIETISDLYEAKAAILAAKEQTSLPVFCTMTFQEDGRTFVGCDPLTAVITLQGLGVDALGVNCSLGPKHLRPVVETILRYARAPVMMQANAGLPAIREGVSVYDTSPEEYAAQVLELAEKGVSILGGCCGTAPETIRHIRKGIAGKKPAARQYIPMTACTSGTKTIALDGVVTEIGERLNPTGKKKMQAALREGNISFLLGEALAQTQAGADILDVNVGLPDLDEPEMLARVMREVQSVVSAPLQIDSADPVAIERAVRLYNGKPVINSVNGKKAVMESIFPIARQYGALVVGLTLDEEGIPPTARGRLEIAKKMLDTALSYGIPKEDLLIDCLVLTASAQQEQVQETLAAIRLVKAELGLKTVLGVSNVSFGLPNRELINATFLAAALGAGLDAAILNPLSVRYREVLDAYRVLNNQDQNALFYTQKHGGEPAKGAAVSPSEGLTLSEIIQQGRKEEAAAAVEELLRTLPPLEIIDGQFIPALDQVGQRFEKGEIFLPQLMQSAGAVQNGFSVIKSRMDQAGETRQSKGRVLLATVHGDIHDIGKNIVGMMLESYGYQVVDLGKDVPAEVVVEAIREKDIRLVGLSALMTTTVKSMKETIEAIRQEGLDCKVFVGGAVLNPEYTAFVGGDFYARDAMESVAIAQRFFV